MFHQIEFGMISDISVFGIDSNQRVLFPSPRTYTVLVENHVPVGKYPSSVSHIMADLPPCMLGRTPIVRTVTAFGFGMHHFKVRIFFVYSRYCPFTVPLESDPFDIFRCGGIIEGGFSILRIIPVDCSEEYFGLNVFFFEFRS